MTHDENYQETEDGGFELTCASCGTHYSIRGDTTQLGLMLQDYAHMGDGATLNAFVLQWLQDVDRVSAATYTTLVERFDRKTVALFMTGDTTKRRGRQAWRAVAGELGVIAPFDAAKHVDG